MNALLTDFYQLTMAAGYFISGKAEDKATFELFVRRLPIGREHLITAGLAQAIEYLENLRFRQEEIDWLRSLPQFSHTPAEFWNFLHNLRFTGDVFALPEGTPVYSNEPLLSIRAPIIEAQLVETFLLATISYQTMIATKASRLVTAAAGRNVVEFGTRRAHSPQAGVYAGRAAYIGGCAGTSNTLAGYQFGIPVVGTAAHSWVLSFEKEREAFEKIQSLLGEYCVQLVDTYDTLDGIRLAAEVGRPLRAIRLDSGNLLELSREARKILDGFGLTDVEIMATNDLDEGKIRDLVESGAPIDAFGVGTALATSSDSPALGAVYKLVEIETRNGTRYPYKHSPEKATLAGAKQVFRYEGFDVIGRANECKPVPGDCTALLRPVMLAGKLLKPVPSAKEARSLATELVPASPQQIELSARLKELQQ